MTTTKLEGRRPTVDEYWSRLAEALPVLTAEEQAAAVAIYRALANGRPLGREDIAAALGVPAETAAAIIATDPLQAFVYADGEGRIVGFGGLAAAPMPHELRPAGRTLWTWCAWDTLFIPAILGETADVASADPETGEPVRLRVAPDRIESASPEEAVVSFLLPQSGDFDTSAANVMAKFCHFVFFFASRASGEKWAARHPGTFLYTLAEAEELARRLVRRLYPDVLG